MADLYAVVVTAVIYRDDKRLLITRRSKSKKKWPGKWTVPGGHLELSDYENLPKDTVNAWYDVLERTVAREVKEEVGLEIKNTEYLTSIAAEYGPDNPHGLIISLIAELDSGEVVLQEGETDKFAWVDVEEAKDYDLIDGIYDEIIMAGEWLKGSRASWSEIKSKK